MLDYPEDLTVTLESKNVYLLASFLGLWVQFEYTNEHGLATALGQFDSANVDKTMWGTIDIGITVIRFNRNFPVTISAINR